MGYPTARSGRTSEPLLIARRSYRGPHIALHFRSLLPPQGGTLVGAVAVVVARPPVADGHLPNTGLLCWQSGSLVVVQRWKRRSSVYAAERCEKVGLGPRCSCSRCNDSGPHSHTHDESVNRLTGEAFPPSLSTNPLRVLLISGTREHAEGLGWPLGPLYL